jgi:lipopolysaccharide transport system permease protein
LQYTLSLGLAAVGAYLRDLQHAVPVAMTGLLFLSPVFYPTASAPPLLQTILLLNPVTTPIELARAAWFGDSVNWTAAAWQGAALLAALVLARWTFRRLRPGFPDLV